jgi:aminopeptidase N
LFLFFSLMGFDSLFRENKSLNVFNSKYILAKPETATDADFDAIDSVIAHEYLHNWSGNRVTLRDWFQLSLKEGLTVFRDQEYSSDQGSRAWKRIQDVVRLQTAQFVEDEGPLAHSVRPDSYVSINNFYTTTVYEKGAEVVRMIRTLLGPKGFRKGMDLYFERHDGQAVTCDDFVRAMEDANNGFDLSQFKLWYSQAGTPKLHVEGHYVPQSREYHLVVRQSCPSTPNQPSSEKKPFHIPLAVGLLGSEGKDMPLKRIKDSEYLVARPSMEESEGVPKHSNTVVLNIKHAIQTIVFQDIEKEPTAVSLNRFFSAPIKLESELRSGRKLLFLMGNDSDSFNRWDASHQLSLKVGLHLIEAINPVVESVPEQEKGKGVLKTLIFKKEQSSGGAALSSEKVRSMMEMVTEAFSNILRDKEQTLDPALVARTLSLPAESSWMDLVYTKFGYANPAVIHLGRQYLRQHLSYQLRDPLWKVYNRSSEQLLDMTRKGEERDVSRASLHGRRALKNVCLSLLMAKEQLFGEELRLHPTDSSLIQQASSQFHSAKCMTDELSALEALSLLPPTNPQRTKALREFYERWKHEPLVMDKWLRLQAFSCSSREAGELLQSPVFDFKNPNKVYSLIGGFAFGNHYHFHSIDGAGYRFLTDQVIHVDSSNPQGTPSPPSFVPSFLSSAAALLPFFCPL